MKNWTWLGLFLAASSAAACAETDEQGADDAMGGGGAGGEAPGDGDGDTSGDGDGDTSGDGDGDTSGDGDGDGDTSGDGDGDSGMGGLAGNGGAGGLAGDGDSEFTTPELCEALSSHFEATSPACFEPEGESTSSYEACLELASVSGCEQTFEPLVECILDLDTPTDPSCYYQPECENEFLTYSSCVSPL